MLTFEAVARHLSFTEAAGELGVSQAATSRQVRILEDHLGVRLFHREHRRIRLTQAGEQLYRAVAMAFGHLAETGERLRAGARGKGLTVATSIAFSAFWLMPRIARFHADHPEVELRLVTSDRESEWLSDSVDLAVIFGPGRRPGFAAERLFGDEVIPVCQPSYLAGRAAPMEPAALLDETLLHMDPAYPSWLTWEDWFARLGLGVPRRLQGPRFSTYTIAMQAGRDGRGMVLGWRRLVEPELAAGTLVRVTGARVVPEDAYVLMVPERSRGDARVRAFRDWIVAEAAADWG